MRIRSENLKINHSLQRFQKKIFEFSLGTKKVSDVHLFKLVIYENSNFKFKHILCHLSSYKVLIKDKLTIIRTLKKCSKNFIQKCCYVAYKFNKKIHVIFSVVYDVRITHLTQYKYSNKYFIELFLLENISSKKKNLIIR